jgi:hypothetical protein
MEEHKFHFELPEHMKNSEQFDSLCRGRFCGRVPRGAQLGSPALLDWMMLGEGLLGHCWLDWYDAPADHAFLCFSIDLQIRGPPLRPKTTWAVSDQENVADTLQLFHLLDCGRVMWPYI